MIDGLTHASLTALQGLDRAWEKVDQAAARVATPASDAPGDSAFAQQLESQTQLLTAKQEIRANLATMDAVDQLVQELLRLPRR